MILLYCQEKYLGGILIVTIALLDIEISSQSHLREQRAALEFKNFSCGPTFHGKDYLRAEA
jgi:hypothetical protein